MTNRENLFGFVRQPFLCGLLWLITATIHAADDPPYWSILVETSSTSPDKTCINHCLTHSMSFGSRGVDEGDVFSVLNQFVPNSLSAVTFKGDDYVRDLFFSSSRNDWLLPGSTMEIAGKHLLDVLPDEIAPEAHTLYIVPSLSTEFSLVPYNLSQDTLVIEFLLPEEDMPPVLPPDNDLTTSVTVLTDRWRFEINLALLFEPRNIYLPGSFTLSLPDSGIRTNFSDTLTPLPEAVQQESGMDITKDTKALSGDIALVIHYPPKKACKNQPTHETRMWIMPRSSDTQPQREPDVFQLEFQPEDPLCAAKGKADKTKHRNQKPGTIDAERLKILIRNLLQADSLVTGESTFDEVNRVMNMMFELLSLQYSLQTPHLQNKSLRNNRASRLQQIELALTNGLLTVLRHFITDTQLGTPVTTLPELLEEGVKYIPLSLMAEILPQFQKLQHHAQREHKQMIASIYRLVQISLLDFINTVKLNGSRTKANSLPDIWDDLRIVVKSFADWDESLINNYSTGIGVIYYLMLFAIEIPDVDMIFFLCGKSHRLFKKIKNPRYFNEDAEGPLQHLKRTYMSAWTVLQNLLPRQDIPVPQLRQLIKDASEAGINTTPWSSEVDRYEQAKNDAIAANREANAAEWEKESEHCRRTRQAIADFD